MDSTKNDISSWIPPPPPLAPPDTTIPEKDVYSAVIVPDSDSHMQEQANVVFSPLPVLSLDVPDNASGNSSIELQGDYDDSAAIYDIPEAREDLIFATPPLPLSPHDDPYLNAQVDEGGGVLLSTITDLLQPLPSPIRGLSPVNNASQTPPPPDFPPPSPPPNHLSGETTPPPPIPPHEDQLELPPPPPMIPPRVHSPPTIPPPPPGTPPTDYVPPPPPGPPPQSQLITPPPPDVTPPPPSATPPIDVNNEEQLYEELHGGEGEQVYEELPGSNDDQDTYEDMSSALVTSYRQARVVNAQPQGQGRELSRPSSGAPQPQPRTRNRESRGERRESRDPSEPTVHILPGGGGVTMTVEPSRMSHRSSRVAPIDDIEPPSYDDLSTTVPVSNPRPPNGGSNVRPNNPRPSSSTRPPPTNNNIRSSSVGSETSILESNDGIALTGFTRPGGFSEEAPPSYTDIFTPTVTTPLPDPTPQQHRPRPAARVSTVTQARPQDHRIPQPQPVLRQESDNGSGLWCFKYASKNLTLAGIYVFLLIIGLLVTAGMLALGLSTFLTTDIGNSDRDPSVYLIAMGSCCLFFVIWHIIALCTGVYMKTRDRRSKMLASWCLRICHCGYFAWIIALGVVSYQIWPNFVLTNQTIIYYMLIAFMGCQYLMFLYCIIECCVDFFLCLDETSN